MKSIFGRQQANKQTSKRETGYFHSLTLCRPWFLCAFSHFAPHPAMLLRLLFYHSLFINVSYCASLRLFYCYCHLPFAIRTLAHTRSPCSSLFCVICSFDALCLSICVHGAATNFRARIKHLYTNTFRTHIATTQKWRFTFVRMWFVSDFLFPFFPAHSRSTFAKQHTHIHYLFLFMLRIFCIIFWFNLCKRQVIYWKLLICFVV